MEYYVIVESEEGHSHTPFNDENAAMTFARKSVESDLTATAIILETSCILEREIVVKHLSDEEDLDE